MAAPEVAPDVGVPGGSIGREGRRRRAKREQRILLAHPRIGRILLIFMRPPQHEEAFRIGEEGEIAVGEAVERAAARVDGVVLHNRRLPGAGGDIDHIAIVPSGIYVIDAKAVTGKIEIRSRWFKPPVLFIGRHDRTSFLEGLDRQLRAVRDVLATAGPEAIPVRGALCFTKADLPLHRTHEMRGHLLLYQRALAKKLTSSGPLDLDRRAEIASVLDAALRLR